MGAQNHEKIDGVYIGRQLSKLSREVLRTVSTITIPMYKLPQAPHPPVISIDSAGGHNTHQFRLQARPKDWGEVLGEVFKRKGAPIPGSSNLSPSPDSPWKPVSMYPLVFAADTGHFLSEGFNTSHQPLSLSRFRRSVGH